MNRRLVHSVLDIFLCISMLCLPGCQKSPESLDETPSPPVQTPVSQSTTPINSLTATPLPAAYPEPGAFTDKTVQPEIQALAAGLDFDPRLIYEYVLNNYDTVPVLGQMKSPRDTFLSKRGNPFDLAVLLSDLLRAAGYQTEFVFGMIELPLDQAMNWLGAENPDVLYHVLDNGGIYYVVDDGKVTLKHIWVRVSIDDAWYELDPSLKEYQVSQGIDLASALGYSRDTYLAAALQGATVTTDYVRGLNSTNIDAQLSQYAANLAQYLRDDLPFASLLDVVGGRIIVPQTVESLPPQVPYTVDTILGTYSDLPVELQYRLHVELPGVDYTVPLPEIAGDRITITYVGATDADRSALEAAGGIEGVYPAYNVQMVPELRINGTLVATGDPAPLGSWQQANLSVTTPYFIHDNPVVWGARLKRLQVGAVYAYSNSLEGISEDALGRHHNLVGEYLAAGLTQDSEPVLGEGLYLIGASWFNQIEMLGYLDAALVGVIFVPQYLAAWISQDLIVTEWVSLGGERRAARIEWGSFNIDASPGNRTICSASGNKTDARAFNTHLEYRASAAEHATLEQLQGVPAWSTVKAMDIANAQFIRIYRIDASNIDDVLPILDQPDKVKQDVRDYVSQGNVVFIPQQHMRYNDYLGTGFWSYDSSTGDIGGLISGMLVYGAAGSFPQTGQVMQTPVTMGGSSTKIIELSIEQLLDLLEMGLLIAYGCNQGCNNPDTNGENNAGADPVDTATGAFLNQTTDFSFGTLGFPIHFTRTYSSERRNANGALGYGWTHNYVLRLATSSEWGRSLGHRTAMDAVASITESYIGLDLARTPEEGLPAEQLLVGTIGASWSTNQVIQNVVTISGFDGEHHQYLRLPDGSFQPSHHDYSTLVMNADQSYTLSDKAGRRVEFDAQGHCLALVDSNGNRTTFKYDTQGLLTGVTDASGRSIQLSYTNGRLSQIVDPAGNQFQYAYDQAGNLASYRDPLGNSTQYTYDSKRRLITLTNPEGIKVLTNTYDAWSRVTQQVDGRGGVLNIRYGDMRSVAVDPMGMPVIYYYDAYQRLIGQEDALQNRTTTLYDSNDNVLQVNDRLGHVTSYNYDKRGNIVRITDPQKNSTLNEYEENNRLLTTTDRTGATTHFAHDANNNVIELTNALGSVTSFTYDPRGLPLSITDANGHRKSFDYDTSGNLIRSTDDLGHTEIRTYDILGRCLSYIDGAGHTSQYVYDPSGHTLQRMDAMDRATTFTYDRSGMLLSVTDARGSVTNNTYDGQYALIQVTDALGNRTRYERDLNGQLVTQIDANGNATRFVRDPLGRIIQIIDPLDRQVKLSYNADGSLASKTKADGRTISYQYDSLGRISKVAYPDKSTEVWEYDEEGRILSASNGSWQAKYSLDALGRILVTDLAEEGVQIAYGYDPVGNRVEIKATRGSDQLYNARYFFDATDRLAKASDEISGYSISYDYSENNTLSTIRQSSGVQMNFLRNAVEQIISLEYLDGDEQVQETVEYEYDAAGNLMRRSQDGVDSLVATYEYDALNRLVTEDLAGLQVEYTYDAVGNRMQRTGSQETLSYIYDAADQLLSAGTTTYTYDANGNQISRKDASGTYSLTYDDRNLLVGITTPTNLSIKFGYDTSGLQVAIQGQEGTKIMVRDGYLAIFDVSDNFSEGQAYLWAVGQLAYSRPLDTTGAGTASGYLGDGLGNVEYLASEEGALTAVTPSDAFGQVLATAEGLENPTLFQGMLGVKAEPALEGLYLMGHRYYDASTGRFLNSDLLPGESTRPQTLNRYSYALANPLRYVDPRGLSPEMDQLNEEMRRFWQEYFQSLDWAETQKMISELFIQAGQGLLVENQLGTNANDPPSVNIYGLNGVANQMVTADSSTASTITCQMATESQDAAYQQWQNLQGRIEASQNLGSYTGLGSDIGTQVDVNLGR
ncbi:MAG: DUF6531 domain-containing protein [Anaerolineaceae bacterium]